MNQINKTLIIGINLGDFGSTGNIMRNSLEYASENGNYDYLIIVPRNSGGTNLYAYQEKELNFLQKVIYHRVLKQPKKKPDGFYETPYTKRIVRKIKEEIAKYRNCFVHLHNIHMANIDLRILFKFLKKEQKITKVFYTLHDEWSYTGGCYYSNYVKCDKWKSECEGKCVQGYAKHNFNTQKQLLLKKKFTLLLKEKLILITVSKWLKNNVESSFLSNVPALINYGETSLDPSRINDLVIEKIRNELNLNNKKVVLAVSAYWNEWKGLKYLYNIADQLPDNYVLLAIGGKIDDHRRIIHINSINQDELPSYYALADVYLSVSQSETLGLTTCEAQMCGTPVVTFGHTAIKETINDKTGIIVGEDNDIPRMIKSIVKVVENNPFNKKDIIINGNRFKKFEHAKRMLNLYNQYNN